MRTRDMEKRGLFFYSDGYNTLIALLEILTHAIV